MGDTCGEGIEYPAGEHDWNPI